VSEDRSEARARTGASGSRESNDAALAAQVAAEAGELLLAVREEVGFSDPYDLGDAGDRRANTLILKRLREERPDDAVLSEEAPDDLARLRADRVWIVDPVDGTREFSMRGRNDWAVHIALWQRSGGAHGDIQGGITDAAVGLPAVDEVYRTDTVLPPPPRTPGPIRIATSANRPPSLLWWLRDLLDVELVGIGSAGAKAMAVVRGDVDAYVHAGGQWEWDSAAPSAVVRAAGLHTSRLDGSALLYNRPDPYLPDFVMCREEFSGTLLDAIRSLY
jgi:3'(2'), 5'-bisphosphate nucleotidase